MDPAHRKGHPDALLLEAHAALRSNDVELTHHLFRLAAESGSPEAPLFDGGTAGERADLDDAAALLEYAAGRGCQRRG